MHAQVDASPGAGELRVAVNVGNPVLAVKDSATGELRGVSIDLSRALGTKLGVSIALIEYATVAQVVEDAETGAWDLAFLASDPARAVLMDFTPAYMEVENSYLVPAGSPIRTLADADRPGIRIAVPNRSAPDLFLSDRLQHARLVRGETGAAAFELLRSGQVDAFAADRMSFATLTRGSADYRAVEESFLLVPHAVAVPRGRTAVLAGVSRFLEEVKSSGELQRAIERAGLRGVRVAPRP